MNSRKVKQKKASTVRANGKVLDYDDPRIKPNWSKRCENCGASPIVPVTGLCGPCTFGEAGTSGGNW